MSHVPSPASSAATILAARRKTGDQGPRLPASCRPNDVDAALAIQEAVTTQMGEHIGAWKCGMPVDGNVVLAPIHAGSIHTSSPCVAWMRGGQVRVEPELAFIIGQDLPARDVAYTSAEIDAAIATTHLALELIDSRYNDPAEVSFAENLADGLLNQGLFIGPEVDNEIARKASTMAIRVVHQSGEERRFDGRHPSVDPRAPLVWLVEFLRSKGRGLQAGQTVITGSYAASFDVPTGQAISFQYGDLGTLTAHFVPK